MTLIIQKPTGAKLVMAKNYPADDDSRAYIAAVEAADGQSLESGVKMAIDAFVLGCKADGIWAAIKASCILAGARTLSGALVPLVGSAPTNVGGLFVSGDYDRKTGLVGDGSTKYLDSNRNNNADPQNSSHLSAFATAFGTTAFGTFLGAVPTTGPTIIYDRNDNARFYAGSRAPEYTTVSAILKTTGLQGVSRAGSATYNFRSGANVGTFSQASSPPDSMNIHVFRTNRDSGDFLYSNHRLAFYSIGESLDLALLDARVTTLINAFAAAIP
jgi:hypothetical protein